MHVAYWPICGSHGVVKNTAVWEASACARICFPVAYRLIYVAAVYLEVLFADYWLVLFRNLG